MFYCKEKSFIDRLKVLRLTGDPKYLRALLAINIPFLLSSDEYTTIV